MMELPYTGWNRIIPKVEFNNVVSYLNKLYQIQDITPAKSQVFNAFKYCSYDNLKVVILGQDPYPQKGVATGVAFGSSINTPDSLKVLKECVINFSIPHNYINFDRSLVEWERQGVLLLNTALTCEINNVGSHTKLWEPFTSKLLINLSKYNTGIVYVLLGNQASGFSKYINARFNHIIYEKHPSYYARTKALMPDIFTKINDILIDIYNNKIKWYEEIL